MEENNIEEKENSTVQILEREEDIPKAMKKTEETESNQEKENIQKTQKKENNENKLEDEKKELIKEESKELKISQKTNKNLIISIIIVITILLLILIGSTIFALINMGNNKIIEGIYIGTTNVSKLTKEEAINKLKQINEQKKQNIINFKCKELEIPITYEALNVQYDIEEVVKDAYNIGRSGNIFIDNFVILKTMIQKAEINPKTTIEEETIMQIIENINNSITDAVVQPSYYIENDKIIITAGKEGINVDDEKFKQEIYKTIKTDLKQQEIEIPTLWKSPENINLEQIHSEIYKEVKDAYYTQNPFTIYPEVKGIDFDIENAKKIIEEKKEEYEIPLIITKPKKTVKDIGTEAFPDLLGTCSTKYNAGNKGRTTNLKLSAGKINGTVLLPGEEFSYNKVVGERTIQAGYKMAATYSNGKVVDGLGGGICQISSTLYDAAVFADLQITKRRNHQFVTSYLPAGKDATVVWGAQDFKFVNSRKYPIKITATVSGGVATIQFWGVKEEVEYDISIETQKIATIAYTTQYIEDPSLPAGQQVVVQNGNNGTKVKAYKVKKLNGKVISKTLLSTDTYNPMKKIVRVGTN